MLWISTSFTFIFEWAWMNGWNLTFVLFINWNHWWTFVVWQRNHQKVLEFQAKHQYIVGNTQIRVLVLLSIQSCLSLTFQNGLKNVYYVPFTCIYYCEVFMRSIKGWVEEKLFMQNFSITIISHGISFISLVSGFGNTYI